MLSKNAIWSIAGTALPAAAALVSIPSLMHLLDYRLFSVTSLLTSIAVFFFVYDFGIGRTVTYFTARTHGDDSKTIDAIFGEALFWATLIGALATLVVFVFSEQFVLHWLKTGGEHLEETVHAFRIAALGIPASILGHLLRGLLEGHQDFRSANTCKMISGVGLFIAPLSMVSIGYGTLVDISCAITVSRYLGLLAYFLSTSYYLRVLQLRILPEVGGPLFSYGIWTAVSGFISSMFVYGDRFVVAGYLNPQALSAYIASQDILIRYLLLPWAMATVLLPQLAQAAQGKKLGGSTYHAHQAKIQWLSLIFLVGVLIFVWLISPLATPTLMLGDARLIVSIQAVGIYFCALAQLPLVYLYAINKPKRIAAIFIFEAIIYVVVAPGIFERYAALGACLVWSGRLLLEYLLLSNWARRLMC